MIRQIFAVTSKELNVLWRDREALALLFAMPVFFILVMSLALQGVFESGSRDRPIEILLINEDRGGLAAKAILDLKKMDRFMIIDTLDGMPVTLKKAKDLILHEKHTMALRFKAQFSAQILSSTMDAKNDDSVISLIVDPTTNMPLISSLKGAIQGIVERHALLSRLPQLMIQGLNEIGEQSDPNMVYIQNELKPTIERIFSSVSAESLDRETVPLAIVPLSAFESKRRPNSAEQNVPAYTIFGVFFIVLTLASSFLQEKNDGTFQRILTAPLSKTALVVGKLLPYYLVNLIQIGLMFAVGIFLFDLQLGNLPALILVSLALSASANGLGLLVAAIGRTEAQVNGLSVLLAITLSALGGMMVPSFLMPGFMETLSQFTPHAWALAGYHDVMIRGLALGDVLGEVGVLFCFSALFFTLALWRFRFD
jgi:ABC-2 type transport system permease protein